MPFPPAHPGLLHALSERGYAEPTAVQLAVLEPRAAGRDLLVSAQTGSGKTVAYGLAIAPELIGDELALPRDSPTLALVVAPTRELALQVQRELGWLYAPTGARVVACVGGMDMRRQERALAAGAAIVVGTPGRLRDHLERGSLVLGGVTAVVVDEADEMLDMGFQEDLEALLDATPATRRTVLFSATIPKPIATLARRYQHGALRLATTDEDEPHGDIEYQAIAVAPRDRERTVVNLLLWFDARSALVFCQTREAVTHLHASLVERGFAGVALSGELTQAERTRALHALRDGRARVCVATDVAARGLDLPDLDLVVHADPPHNRATLLHRSGRTGRAGRKGVAVVLVPAAQCRRAERTFHAARVQVSWMPPPAADAIRARAQTRFAAELAGLAADASADEVAAARTLLAERTPEEVALALLRLQRAAGPAPEDISPVATPAAAPPRRGPPRGDAVWFRLDIGRTQDADPRWLIPMLCTRGGITKAEIGAIRIGARETRVEIAPDVADRFAAAVARRSADRHRRHVRIELVR